MAAQAAAEINLNMSNSYVIDWGSRHRKAEQCLPNHLYDNSYTLVHLYPMAVQFSSACKCCACACGHGVSALRCGSFSINMGKTFTLFAHLISRLVASAVSILRSYRKSAHFFFPVHSDFYFHRCSWFVRSLPPDIGPRAATPTTVLITTTITRSGSELPVLLFQMTSTEAISSLGGRRATAATGRAAAPAAVNVGVSRASARSSKRAAAHSLRGPLALFLTSRACVCC